MLNLSSHIDFLITNQHHLLPIILCIYKLQFLIIFYCFVNDLLKFEEMESIIRYIYTKRKENKAFCFPDHPQKQHSLVVIHLVKHDERHKLTNSPTVSDYLFINYYYYY
jgi:Leucine-rich repeat (LRR) protein